MISVDELLGILRDRVPAVHVEVKDLTGTSDHFEALVVADAFEGKSLIERHRLVYAAIGDHMKREIHALTLKTQTPAEWKT